MEDILADLKRQAEECDESTLLGLCQKAYLIGRIAQIEYLIAHGYE